ncbi:MAG: cytochrome c family protein [Desulfobacula sp.]|uniref:multiheme c-type cytochrome n=1 Tax=Desulfobacula sp. TaxID=2593537 RepID=UPI0025C36C38|nr:multiheme c-type cytochrome [Desulfobacula sp.]MCD4719447.1 cytochrome c family protein [Desulfobacula sp.]
MLNYKKWIKISSGLSVGVIMLFVAIDFASSEDTIHIDRFISPDTCSGCHSEIFEQWENSMHHLAHKDSVYLRVAQFLRKGLTDEGQIKEAESCVKCHTPVGYVTGFPKKLTDDLSKTAQIATQGIQCDYCHSVESVEKMYNNGLVLKPGQGEDEPGIKYGPFDDSAPDFHEAQFSKLHTESEICGTCHDVNHVVFGTPVETTYTEWKNGPYNSKDPKKKITCQGCHMYQRPSIPATGSTNRPENPGAATDYSDERPHIFTHYFVGANSYVPGKFGGQEKSRMAIERLENAATLSVDISKISQKKLNITVTNVGAGHSIPTGVGDLRQVWLEVTIQDKDNQTNFQAGMLNDKHELSKDAVIFRTVFGDGKGNPVINIAKAKQILSDNRIKAKQSVTETIDLPGVPEKDALVIVRLLYRGMPQKILNLIPGKPFEPLPIIEMAKVQKQI